MAKAGDIVALVGLKSVVTGQTLCSEAKKITQWRFSRSLVFFTDVGFLVTFYIKFVVVGRWGNFRFGYRTLNRNATNHRICLTGHKPRETLNFPR